MYQSRLHITNGILSLAADALSGDLLEFTREDKWDNALKNHVRKTWSLLDGILHTDGGDLRFHPPRYLEIQADPSLTPVIEAEQTENGGRFRMVFPALCAEGKRVEIGAQIQITLREGDCRSYWRLTLENRTPWEIDDVAFPAVDGLWLGETWEDDVLALPRFAGWQVENPTRALAQTPPRIHWKWQEYIYEYNLGQACGALDDRGAWALRMNYSGEASMVWMDLYDPGEDTGIYLACRNEKFIMKSLRAESFGEGDPGVGLAVLHHPCLNEGTWHSEECVLAFHPGDWHWGADDYRAWFSTVSASKVPPFRPAWFEKSPGLMAHYDFQYQGGGIVHRYRDIPRLLEMAQDLGIHHLLLSGWNRDGFDNGFPHYEINPLLGTEEELRQALARCRQMGGHVAFYINSRLCNTAFEDQQERLKQSAVMRRDGQYHIERYGAADIHFASMCINDTPWRRFLTDTVRYLTRRIGADSMYLDQFAMATSVNCYHPGHAEHKGNPAAWNQGYEKLLEEMERDLAPEGMALLYEGCNDCFGPWAAGQLITTLGGPFQGRKPEIYRYTFPDQILMDMMNPRRNSAMRAEHVARHSTEFLHLAFVTGMYFWCYDLEWDNTWRRDPEQYERLKKIVALRTAWLDAYGHGRFTDTVGLLAPPQGQLVKRFDLDGGVLLACAAEGGLTGRVLAAWEKDSAQAEVRTLSSPGQAKSHPCRLEQINGKTYVSADLPPDEAAVIVIR